MFNLVSTRSPRPFSAEFLSIRMPPACPHAWTVPPQMQDLHYFLELHEIPISPPLQPVEVPFDDSKVLWCIPPSCVSRFSPILLHELQQFHVKVHKTTYIFHLKFLFALVPIKALRGCRGADTLLYVMHPAACSCSAHIGSSLAAITLDRACS